MSPPGTLGHSPPPGSQRDTAPDTRRSQGHRPRLGGRCTCAGILARRSPARTLPGTACPGSQPCRSSCHLSGHRTACGTAHRDTPRSSPARRPRAGRLHPHSHERLAHPWHPALPGRGGRRWGPWLCPLGTCSGNLAPGLKPRGLESSRVSSGFRNWPQDPPPPCQGRRGFLFSTILLCKRSGELLLGLLPVQPPPLSRLPVDPGAVCPHQS